ncbi:plasmid stabilization system [Desulfofarcimen acetoxidans DSM 771]|jgi:plasmid stabilization system protein ParE|uniref:Plasmid stabilization system n=1 Tax=Desulfofarcimen acetoxidans (strain ATCC 49208 / DSM 771 / KCTC 5769 / VKM B-1644 / 5575) TaxID=485916 RepID=C8W1A4_DESAS|nr:type II toxin-antitoxin system RelE/ParE family toxin [Desulfofarcimen acetoxidans]ACV61549.1 plasmid stabilization system [Desulfofarcimen acetoxidans DSM 771]
MYKLVVSELAHEDLDNIVAYIVVELANPIVAANFLDEVEKYYGYLKNNPFMYERCHDAHLEKETYRKATIKNYVLVYKVDEPNRVVIIYRFFYGAQDYVKLI